MWKSAHIRQDGKNNCFSKFSNTQITKGCQKRKFPLQEKYMWTSRLWLLLVVSRYFYNDNNCIWLALKTRNSVMALTFVSKITIFGKLKDINGSDP